jgi:hypothetical protein
MQHFVGGRFGGVRGFCSYDDYDPGAGEQSCGPGRLGYVYSHGGE